MSRELKLALMGRTPTADKLWQNQRQQLFHRSANLVTESTAALGATLAIAFCHPMADKGFHLLG
jgi:hypothetical protein